MQNSISNAKSIESCLLLHCKTQQWLSGSGLWVKSAFDGHKFVCADDFRSNFGDDENCLVYSFGLSDDTSFEEAMAEAGCEVVYKRAHLIRFQDGYSDKFAMPVSYMKLIINSRSSVTTTP